MVAAGRTAKQFLTFVASGPFQYAVAEALALPDPYYTALRDDPLAVEQRNGITLDHVREIATAVMHPA